MPITLEPVQKRIELLQENTEFNRSTIPCAALVIIEGTGAKVDEVIKKSV